MKIIPFGINVWSVLEHTRFVTPHFLEELCKSVICSQR